MDHDAQVEVCNGAVAVDDEGMGYTQSMAAQLMQDIALIAVVNEQGVVDAKGVCERSGGFDLIQGQADDGYP